MQRSIQPLFHSHRSGFYNVFDLVEFAVISDGEVIPERTLLSNAENLDQFSQRGCGLVYIDFRNGLYRELCVVHWKIFYQEFVCLLDVVNLGKPHFFNQTVLKR